MTSVNTEVYDTEIWEFFSNCNAVSHKCDETCDSQALDYPLFALSHLWWLLIATTYEGL